MSKPQTPVATTQQIEVIPVRELMRFTPLEVLHGLRTHVDILFEDNKVIRMLYIEAILNRYIFDIVALNCPEVPLISKYHIGNYYTNGIYTAKTFNKCFKVMLEDMVILSMRPSGSRALLPNIYSTMQEVINAIYNEVVYELIQYATSVHIKMLLELQFKPELIEAMQDVAVKKDVASVNKTYTILDKVMRDNPDNPIARGYIAGTINPNQIKQMLASRGYITEIDGKIFKYPVASSFVLGLHDLYSITIESRAGAKALFLSAKAVAESEYFAREMQLVCMGVQHVVDGDCGNRDYVDWYVKPATESNKSDLPNLVGKRYLDEDGVEKIITKKDTHLEGKRIKLRMVMNCKLADKRCICSSCFGELSYSIFKHTNIGHYCSTTATRDITQNILSTKHLTSSATSNEVALNEVSSQYFYIKNSNDYYFKPLPKGSDVKYKIVVSQAEAFGIMDLNPSIGVENIDPTRVSRIRELLLVVESKDNAEYIPIVIKDNNKYGSFTQAFLRHMLTTAITLDKYDRYVIDMAEWNFNNPFITMPAIEYSYLLLAKNIKTMIKWMKSDDEDDVNSDTSESPLTLIQKMFDMINTKLNVNLAHIEVIVYGHTIMSKEDGDYDLGRNSPKPALMRLDKLFVHRSLGGLYGWERLNNLILSPHTFNGRNAIDHPLDVLIKPNEVIKAEYGKMVN